MTPHRFAAAGFPHRALAALRASLRRSSAVMLSILALPPLSPPRRPRATARGSLPGEASAASVSSAQSPDHPRGHSQGGHKHRHDGRDPHDAPPSFAPRPGAERRVLQFRRAVARPLRGFLSAEQQRCGSASKGCYGHGVSFPRWPTRPLAFAGDQVRIDVLQGPWIRDASMRA